MQPRHATVTKQPTTTIEHNRAITAGAAAVMTQQPHNKRRHPQHQCLLWYHSATNHQLLCECCSPVDTASSVFITSKPICARQQAARSSESHAVTGSFKKPLQALHHQVHPAQPQHLTGRKGKQASIIGENWVPQPALATNRLLGTTSRAA
jgi:hypothetical protein